MSDTVVTQGELIPHLLWIGTLGKLLVQKGVLNKNDIIKEFEEFRDTIPGISAAEVNAMIATVQKWNAKKTKV